jgi:hypothetical protein
MDFETLRTAIITHQRERTFVNDKTAVEEIDKLQEEVEELRESLLEAEIGGGATEVAGELADAFRRRLVYNYTHENKTTWEIFRQGVPN